MSTMPNDLDCSTESSPEETNISAVSDTSSSKAETSDEYGTNPVSNTAIENGMSENLGGSMNTDLPTEEVDLSMDNAEEELISGTIHDAMPTPSHSAKTKPEKDEDLVETEILTNPQTPQEAEHSHAVGGDDLQLLPLAETLVEGVQNAATTVEQDTCQEKSGQHKVSLDFSQEHTDPTLPEPNQYIDLAEYYKHKNILLTGATGFVGKAILWKLIHCLGNEIGKIYLFLREGGDQKRGSKGGGFDRVKNEILNNKAFVDLRRKIGPIEFDTIVKDKLVRVTGDIISPDLSLSYDDREAITSNVNVIIHCAATRDYQERLDLSLETNTLGTLRLMDLAEECKNMKAFVHMSLAYREQLLPDGSIQERVYPMEAGDPEVILNDLVTTELDGLFQKTEAILKHYPNTYTFTKTLTEHLILKRVDGIRIDEIQNTHEEKKQWPVAIVRATQVGAGAFEPLAGWVDGVTGFNSTVFLTGRGIQSLSPNVGDLRADIVPVDYLARIVIGCPADMKDPGRKFTLPYNEILNGNEPALKNIQYFPYIYQVTARGLQCQTKWREIYDASREYWMRTTKVSLPTSENYFSSSKAVHKVRMLMKSWRSSVTSAINRNSNGSLRATGSNNRENAITNLALHAAESAQPFIQRQWALENTNVQRMQVSLASNPSFDLALFQNLNWRSYMMNYCFGTHTFVVQAPLGLRTIVPSRLWDCALYSKHETARDSTLGHEIKSVIFSESDIMKRTDRMLSVIISSLENPEHNMPDKEEWVNDFDASLDDWCHDDSKILHEDNDWSIFGYWPSKNRGIELIFRSVFHDKRVMENVQQVAKNSGVPEQTAYGEVQRFLNRMYERTQLPYVLFAGAFLDSLFKRLFESINIQEADVQKLKSQVDGKKVVYVPTSKTLLDPLLVWYLCLRYNWPVPAIACDEALALLGSISDILRIAGAFFVRRDSATRSPMNTHVTAAYIGALLNQHGSITLSLEKARSRTGRLQGAYRDGLLGMVLDSTTEDPSTGPNVDTVFIPIHINYEKVPGLQSLIDQGLDQKPSTPAAPKPPSGGLARSTSFLRPSASQALRSKDADQIVKQGRVYIGVGPAIDAREIIQEATSAYDEDKKTTKIDKAAFIEGYVAREIQKNQCKAEIVTPVAITAAVILSGRSTEGIPMGQLYEQVEWLCGEVQKKQIPLDWRDEEDVPTVVAYALDLLDTKKHVSINRMDRRRTEKDLVRCVEHADNIMALSFMANQLVDVFLPEACLSVVLLSCESTLSRDEIQRQFQFLAALFKSEFINPPNLTETFTSVFERFIADGFVTRDASENCTAVTTASDSGKHAQLSLLASLVYPTLDAFWITGCSLSALNDIPFIPRKVVPVLAQWIAFSLISGKKTMYREVQSLEASQSALDSFLELGFITAVDAKTRLSPDAQILLMELSTARSEELILSASKDTRCDNAKDGQDIMSQLEDVASLCDTIEKYRAGWNNNRSAGKLQVFKQCQNQIRQILRADKSYAMQRGQSLVKEEDQMIQLIHSLKTPQSHYNALGA